MGAVIAAPAARGSAPAVRAEGISKRFKRGERQDSLRDLIPALVRRAARRHEEAAAGLRLDGDEFWAVKDVSFDVEFGRALGIIGPNGAGKSTMLKLLTGILRPSAGEIRMRGRVASLIEVAAGFHQDLTGRENVYLQGAIMGMTRREVDRRLDSIVDFSGIEAFIDTPVKRYSSGMNARLGFAIAVHLNPDVLVIDEVLSVGDMAFQQKCVERMNAFKRDGVAIVFVSHNMQAIGELCEDALVIKGTTRYHGDVGTAVMKYLELGQAAAPADRTTGAWASNIRLRTPDGADVTIARPHAALVLEADLHFDRDFAELELGVAVRRATDALVVSDNTLPLSSFGFDRIRAGTTLRVRLEHAAHLCRGQYAYELNLYAPQVARHVLWLAPAAGLRIDEYDSWAGIANLEFRADVTPAAAGPEAAGLEAAGVRTRP